MQLLIICAKDLKKQKKKNKNDQLRTKKSFFLWIDFKDKKRKERILIWVTLTAIMMIVPRTEHSGLAFEGRYYTKVQKQFCDYLNLH